MVDSTTLFHNVPTSIFQVISTVFSIFQSEWKTLILFTSMYLVSIATIAILLGVFLFICFSTELMNLAALFAMKAGEAGGGGVRQLLDYSSGVSGASRLLSGVSRAMEGYYDYDGDDGTANPNFDVIKFVATLLFVFITMMVVISFAASVFVGSQTHAVGEIYAGNTPDFQTSFERGWARKWTVLAYQILHGILSFSIFMVTFIIPFLFEVKHDIDEAGGDPNNINPMNLLPGAFLFGVITVIIFVVLSSLLAASLPAMIVENKSALQAFKRSYELCKGYICFIFCAMFCYNVLLAIAMQIVNILLSKLPAFIAIILHLLVNVVTCTIVPM
jgi:hypothetical protein